MGEKINKHVGYIEDLYIEKFGLIEHKNKPIMQALKLYVHTAKQCEEFMSVDSFNYTMDNISEIISNPYYVYYDKPKNSLRYYKFLKEYVCVIVKLTNKRILYVATVYPVSEDKINKLEWQQEREKYEYKKSDVLS